MTDTQQSYDFVLPVGTSAVVKIVKIHACAKIIPSRGGQKCRNDIYISKEGKETKAQFLTKPGEPLGLEEGAYQRIQCLQVFGWGEMEVALVLPEVPVNESVSRGTQVTTYVDADKKVEHLENMYNAKVPGTIACFSIAYAKDLMIAEMQHWRQDRQLQPEDIERMLSNSTMIADRMYEMVTT